jgi:hypothetical protein
MQRAPSEGALRAMVVLQVIHWICLATVVRATFVQAGFTRVTFISDGA